MSALRVVLFVAVIAGCAESTPYVPPAIGYAKALSRCRVDLQATPENTAACFTAAEWLAFEGKADAALALHRRVCEMGDVRSCVRVFDRHPDPDTAWRLCTNSRQWPGACALGWTSQLATDARRVDFIRERCFNGSDECVTLLALELRGDRRGIQAVADLCAGATAAPDRAVCMPLATAPWARPGMAPGLWQQLGGRGCRVLVAELCVIASEQFDGPGPEQLAARRDLLGRGCARGSVDACRRAEVLDGDEAARTACRSGDAAACERVGAAVVRRETPW